MEIVQRKLEQSATLVHLAAVPVVILLSWLFGTFVVWGSLVVVYVLFCVRQVSDRKIEMYDYMAKDMLDADRESEHAEWLNQFVRKYWVSCVPSLVKPHIDNLQNTLEQNKPAWLHSLAVGEWSMGSRAPRIEVIYPNSGLPDDAMQFDIALHFVSDAFLTIVLTLPTRQSVTIRADGIMFRGNLRCNFKFNTIFPNASVIGISFVDDPMLEFAIKPLGGIDVISLPTIYDWLQDIIKTQLKPMMVWPQELRFTMGAGAPEDKHLRNEPIIDVGLVCADELRVPSGWVVIARASCGTIPANLNRGTGGREMFICYRRQPKKWADDETPLKPITGLAVIYTSDLEEAPPGFTLIRTTVNELNEADLNLGNEKGGNVFLAYTRAEGTPITSLAVLNKTTADAPPLNFNPIQLTPHGKVANVNPAPEADPIFLCYRGGPSSIFGHATQCRRKGLLRVEVKQAKQLKAADMGGTSDPYVVLNIAGRETEKFVSSVKDKTLSPKWNEVFTLQATAKDVLHISVFDKDAVGSDDFLGGIAISLENLVAGEEITSWCALDIENTGEIQVSVCALNFGALTRNPDLAPELSLIPMVLPEKKKKKDKSTPEVAPESRTLRWSELPQVEVKRIHTCTSAVLSESLADLGESSSSMTSAADGWKTLQSSITTASAISAVSGEAFVEKAGVLEKVERLLNSKKFFHLFEDKLYCYEKQKNFEEKKDGKIFELGSAQLAVAGDRKLSLKNDKGAKLELIAPTEEEFSEWVKSIRTNISASGERA